VVYHGAFVGDWDDSLRDVDRLVALRKDLKRALIERGAKAERVVTLEPSIDSDVFTPAVNELTDNSPVLGFVGRVETAKGAFEIPRVVARLVSAGVNATAELIGPYTEHSQQLLAAATADAGMDGRVKLVGQFSTREVAQRMREWRLLLVPSYGEGYGLVVLEACKSRLPVAAITGVLTTDLSDRPGVRTASRDRYPDLVLEMMSERNRPPFADWVPGHDLGATQFDALLDSLPPWVWRPRPRHRSLQRLRRFKPVMSAYQPALSWLRPRPN
jgi:hypothetical protein